MQTAQGKVEGSARKTSSTESTAFHVSVEDGKIVLDPLVSGALRASVTLEDVLLAADDGAAESTDGLTVSAEIVAQAKADKVTVFKKKRRHNYRRKRGHRQQLTILKIVAIGGKKAVIKALTETKSVASSKPARRSSELLNSSESEDALQLEALAADLNAAADRMGNHLDRAIEAVRVSLDPEREIACRKRFEAEFSGNGFTLPDGLQ